MGADVKCGDEDYEGCGARGTKRKKVESSMRFTFEEEFDEGAEEMRWLAKCDAKGLCYECGAKHHGRAAEYWIVLPDAPCRVTSIEVSELLDPPK